MHGSLGLEFFSPFSSSLPILFGLVVDSFGLEFINILVFDHVILGH